MDDPTPMPMPGVLTIAERIQHHRCRWCEWHPATQGHHPECPRPTSQKEPSRG